VPGRCPRPGPGGIDAPQLGQAGRGGGEESAEEENENGHQNGEFGGD
jgi:hypothetical protein